jgi:sarcosine oxidase delta subunit
MNMRLVERLALWCPFCGRRTEVEVAALCEANSFRCRHCRRDAALDKDQVARQLMREELEGAGRGTPP